MKLRLDLVEQLTANDLLKAAKESVHRFKPEPNFAKTGVGSLLPASPEDRAREIAEGEKLIRKLKRRARKAGKQRANPS